MKKIKAITGVLFFIFHFSISQAQYMLYGTTEVGGAYNKGTIYNFNPFTNVETVLFNFDGSDGFEPDSRLIYVSDSLLYGTTYSGGTNGIGTVYSFNCRTNVENVVINYDTINGYLNAGGNELIESKNGLLYGTAWGGGSHLSGVLYNYNLITNKDSVLYNFDSLISGWAQFMALWEDTLTGILYGVAEAGGKYQGGVLFGFNTITNQDSVYVSFKWGDTMGAPFRPSCTLLKASNGLLYGMTDGGGDSDVGTIYTFNTNTGIMDTVFQFNNINGQYPDGNGLIQLSNGLIYGTTAGYPGTGNYGTIFSFDPTTNIENVLVRFNDTNGSLPQGYLMQDPDNELLYGITSYGGSAGEGVLYSYDITTSTYTKLLDFTGPNGAGPVGSLTLVKDTSISMGVGKVNKGVGDVKVYPNPNKGSFTLCLSNNNQKCSVEIYNVFGEKIYSETLPERPNNNINLTGQPSGVYFYRVLKENGELVGEGKVIIQK